MTTKEGILKFVACTTQMYFTGWGIFDIRILGLTHPNNQVSLTAKERSARWNRKGGGWTLPWCNHIVFVQSDFVL